MYRDRRSFTRGLFALAVAVVVSSCSGDFIAPASEVPQHPVFSNQGDPFLLTGQVQLCKYTPDATSPSWVDFVASAAPNVGSFPLGTEFRLNASAQFPGNCEIVWTPEGLGGGWTTEITITEVGMTPGMALDVISVIQPGVDRVDYRETSTVVVGVSQGVGATVIFKNRGTPEPAAPAIALVKLTNGTDNNDHPTGPLVPAGSTVTWTYEVTNPGSVTLTNVMVTDDNGTPGNLADDFQATCPETTLAPGETMICSATGNAIEGQYVNWATASGYFDGTEVTAEDPDRYFGEAAGRFCPANSVGGLDLSALTNEFLFFFANGSQDANWQGATKGFVGNVAVNGVRAKQRTSGGVPFAGTIYTNDTSLGAWQNIVSQTQNAGQAFRALEETSLIGQLDARLTSAIVAVSQLAVTPGFESRSATSLAGDYSGRPETQFVINVTTGFGISSKINITGRADQVFILRWDSDANPANGFQGQVKFQSGGAIVPLGGLLPSNFFHVAGDLNASGGGSNPAPPYPQGPRLDNGQGALINGGSNFSGGGFFTGYWLTTGAPTILDPATGLYFGNTASLSNAIFVGGWYSITNKFSMTSGTSGVHIVCP
jgi:hypothetical protein